MAAGNNALRVLKYQTTTLRDLSFFKDQRSDRFQLAFFSFDGRLFSCFHATWPYCMGGFGSGGHTQLG